MKNRATVLHILILTTIGYVATDIYLPSFPAMTSYFLTTNTWIQLTLPAYLLSFAVLPLFSGPLSDKIGRRRVILPGLILAIASTFVILLSASVGLLIIARFFQGFGLGAVNVASRAVIADLFKGRERAKLIAYMGMIIPIILSCVPPIGGIIQEYYGWRAVFFTLLCYEILIFLMCITSFSESNDKLEPHAMENILSGYLTLTKNKRFLAYAVIPAFSMMGINAYLTASPYIFQNKLGLSPSQYGYVSLALGSTVITGSFINGKALNFFSSERILFVSVFLMLSSGLALAAIHVTHFVNITSVITACMIYFMSLNFAFANATALAFEQIETAFGRATAFIAFIQMMSGMFISAIISFLPENDVLPIATVFILASLFTFTCAFIGHRLSGVSIANANS